MVFALSRTGMQRSRVNSDEVEDFLGEVSIYTTYLYTL